MRRGYTGVSWPTRCSRPLHIQRIRRNFYGVLDILQVKSGT
jgi:hypothetical protein